MKILILILTAYSSVLLSQEFTPEFDFNKFINDGGISKKIYTLNNNKFELSDTYIYDKNSNKIFVTVTNRMQSDGSSIDEVIFTLDSKNRISTEEIKSRIPNVGDDSVMSQILQHHYFDSGKTISFLGKTGQIFMKKFFFYKDDETLAESLTISNNNLTIHERNLYFKVAEYDICESQTFTVPRYKVTTKTKLDKSSLPVKVEIEGKMYPTNKGEIPKQVFYYFNELDTKGNLYKVYEIIDNKKKLIKRIETNYNN